jgi:hypothetical protein
MKHVEATARDFIRIFGELGIPYALMGGLAVRAYGVPRPTYDVDIVILIADDQLPVLCDAVEAAGYTVPEIYRRGWLDKLAGMSLLKFRIYRSGDDESVDVDLFVTSTAFQRQMIERRVPVEVENLGQTWIIRPEELILLKLIAGRPRDLGDIGDVRFMVGELDADYMRHWALRLGILPALDALLEKPPL